MKTVSIDELGAVFAQALSEIITKVSGFSFDVLSEKDDTSFDECVALMSLNSIRGGVLFISAEESCLRVLCSYMVGIPEVDINKTDIEDVLCELVNMTAGNAKLHLNDTEYMFSLSLPFIINGTGLSITAKKRANIISRTLGSGDVSVKLKVVY